MYRNYMFDDFGDPNPWGYHPYFEDIDDIYNADDGDFIMPIGKSSRNSIESKGKRGLHWRYHQLRPSIINSIVAKTVATEQKCELHDGKRSSIKAETSVSIPNMEPLDNVALPSCKSFSEIIFDPPMNFNFIGKNIIHLSEGKLDGKDVVFIGEEFLILLAENFGVGYLNWYEQVRDQFIQFINDVVDEKFTIRQVVRANGNVSRYYTTEHYQLITQAVEYWCREYTRARVSWTYSYKNRFSRKYTGELESILSSKSGFGRTFIRPMKFLAHFGFSTESIRRFEEYLYSIKVPTIKIRIGKMGFENVPCFNVDEINELYGVVIMWQDLMIKSQQIKAPRIVREEKKMNYDALCSWINGKSHIRPLTILKALYPQRKYKMMDISNLNKYVQSRVMCDETIFAEYESCKGYFGYMPRYTRVHFNELVNAVVSWTAAR